MNKKNEILEAAAFRRAIKDFDSNKTVSPEDFEFLMEVGRLSPSSFGWEPWKFLVVQSQELRDKISEPSWGAQKQLASASHFVILLARKGDDMTPGSDYLTSKSKDVDQLPDDVAQMKLDFFTKFQQNEFDLTNERKLFDWASKQVYIPLGNMMSAAAQIGIDSCPIEGFDRASVESILSDSGVLDTDHLGVAAMVAFGYRKEDSPFPRTRHTYESVVQFV